ncbi:hypothetical protein DUNSADRAFT_11116 [Dunaliella salina]|uniref:Secreted protein n=1 Tax=Dunaliella salina TaxID=3046 RepID=A0ABQ7H4M3_DUNSA|nr:hypothetical protein DUNSADRAFT_11116 [Dunaliella salina]|eukprot:KAF5841800.1 hypothetical protein DUNSADRAFT_11116 [Dunaliella salina]
MICSCLIAIWCFASTPMSLETTVSRLRSSCSARTVQRVPYGVSGSPANTCITSSVASTFFPAFVSAAANPRALLTYAVAVSLSCMRSAVNSLFRCL